MGFLGKAIARKDTHTESSASANVQSVLADFHRKNSPFHALVLAGSGDIINRISCHGAELVALPGGNTLVLLPGALDRELFAHRIGHSSGLAILFQSSADSPSLALKTLGPYLQ